MVIEKIIKNSTKRILRLNLIKVFSLTAISTSVKLLTSFVSIKVIAGILGPSGIALIGQLNNFITIMMASLYKDQSRSYKICFRI